MENGSKTASSAGMAAKLHCRAIGAPAIRFSWDREGTNIINVSEKYIMEEKRVIIITFIIVISAGRPTILYASNNRNVIIFQG